MKRGKVLSSILVFATFFYVMMPVVNAQSYTNGDSTGESSNYDISTRYDAKEYVRPVETYDVDLVWDDLHWVFVYEGDVTNPSRSIWMTKANYDSHRTTNNDNDYNYDILSNMGSYSNLDLIDIEVINNSNFAVNVNASILQVNNVNDYTNSAGLKVSSASNISYGNEASLVSIARNANGVFLVKPTATRYVNDSDTMVNVTGEVKLSFAKAA